MHGVKWDCFKLTDNNPLHTLSMGLIAEMVGFKLAENDLFAIRQEDQLEQTIDNFSDLNKMISVSILQTVQYAGKI